MPHFLNNFVTWLKQNWLPVFVLSALLTGVILIALSTTGLMSPSIANTITSLSTFGQFVIALVALSVAISFATLKHLWGRMTKKSSILSSLLVTMMIVGVLLFAFSWHPAITEAAPVCDSSDGTTWNTPVQMQGTTISCTKHGLVMQQTSSLYYAEEDLEQLHGQPAAPGSFRVRVQVTFLNPNDTKTLAALILQTPVTNGIPGGYIFALNSHGFWMLQQVITGENIPPISNGVLSDVNLSQPITISVVVKDNVLSVSINNSLNDVVHINDTLPPGLVGLMVELPHAAPSSKILYSNFELDRM